MTTLIRRGAIEKWPAPDAADVVRLEPGDDPAQVAGRLAACARVEVNFPRATDGRGYSIARLLRERHGYRGELRAVGDVGRDQIFYLWRCGFDAFLLPDDRSADEALAALGDFTAAYQLASANP